MKPVINGTCWIPPDDEIIHLSEDDSNKKDEPDLSVNHLGYLWCIVNHPHVNAKEIAKTLNLPSGTAQRTLDFLVRHGFVVKNAANFGGRGGNCIIPSLTETAFNFLRIPCQKRLTVGGGIVHGCVVFRVQKKLKVIIPVSDILIEQEINNRRPDILCKLTDGNYITFEVSDTTTPEHEINNIKGNLDCIKPVFNITCFTSKSKFEKAIKLLENIAPIIREKVGLCLASSILSPKVSKLSDVFKSDILTKLGL